MKRIMLLFFVLHLFTNCSTVKKNNAHLEQLILPDQLKKDVDFVYKKLQKRHPNLYYYSSKEKLDYKFDSLKTTITTPLKPLEFYKKISPVVAAIRQGHTYVLAPEKEYSKKETKAIIKNGVGPFSQFDFSFYDNKLYVFKNKSHNKTIAAGTEVLSVNGVQPQKLIAEYNQYYSSDGFNETLKKNGAARRFVAAFTTEFGIKDSLSYIFKSNDSIKTVTIKRFKDSITKKDSKKSPKITSISSKSQHAFQRKKRINGYDKTTKTFIRSLDFFPKDSSVAILKIKAFKKGKYHRFYKESFAKIQKQDAKTLIIDLRNNGGGRLAEIVNLYSYLADSTFIFLEKSEVVSRASVFEGAYYNSNSVAEKAVKTLFSPFVYGYLLFSVHKDKEGKNYFATETKPHKINKNAFSGQMYVLINGGSFSASSILSSNLKGAGRALFIGEETGGDYNGTVAGFMPVVKLPHSELKVRVGIMNVKPYYQTDVTGHGIYPDILIKPTLEDLIQQKDTEIDWLKKNLKE